MVEFAAVAAGERPCDRRGVTELPADGGFRGRDSGSRGRAGVGGDVFGNLGEEVACVRVEIVGQDNVIRGVCRLIPAQLSDGSGGSDGLVFPFALEADEFSGFCIYGGLSGIGACFNARRENDRDGAERVGRIDRNNLDAGPEIRAIHQKKVAGLGVVAGFGGEIGRQINDDGVECAGGVGVDRTEGPERDAVVDLGIAGGRRAGGIREGGPNLDRGDLADGDGHLAIEMFLDEPGGRGGGIDLLILMHHPEHHHDGRGHDTQHGQADGQADENLDQGEGAAQGGAGTPGSRLAKQAHHGVARVTVIDWV